MEKFHFLPLYVKWHYSLGIRDFIENAQSIIAFPFRFFSFAEFIRTLLVPWRRISDRYVKGFDPGKIAEIFAVNLLMRILGAVMRIAVMILGLCVWLITVFFVVIGFFVWVLFPLVIVFLIAVGLHTFFI